MARSRTESGNPFTENLYNKEKKLDANDLDDYVLGIVESAHMNGDPIIYALGPMSDRRAKQQFRQRNLRVAKDRLCGSIKRLEAMSVLRRVPTGDYIVGSGSCGTRRYDVVELRPALPLS